MGYQSGKEQRELWYLRVIFEIRTPRRKSAGNNILFSVEGVPLPQQWEKDCSSFLSKPCNTLRFVLLPELGANIFPATSPHGKALCTSQTFPTTAFFWELKHNLTGAAANLEGQLS